MTNEAGAGRRLICELCDVPMVPLEAQFSYLKRTFRHAVLRCPKCGQVYVSEDTAGGRMKDVETALEDK
jgi:RNase P subunit RPR2